MKLFAIQQLLIVVFGLMLFCANVNAATERVVDYEYDGAGNIVRILTFEQSDPPIISPLDPVFINIGQTISVNATGTNLLGVNVTADDTELGISNINASSTDVTFALTASNLAPIGPAVIRFTTGIGEAQQTIFVAEVGPGLKSDPSPITIDTTGSPRNITFTFSEPRPQTEVYELTLVNSSVATTDANFSISAGETEVTVPITGLAAGNTVLRIVNSTQFFLYAFPIFVGETYGELIATFPELAQNSLFTRPVSVLVQSSTSYEPLSVTSDRVGVLVDSNAAIYADPVGVFFGDGQSGQLFSSPVGIFYGDGQSGRLISSPVGVIVSDNLDYAVTRSVGAVYGPIVDASQPSIAILGTTVDFEISGFNLNEIQTVTVSPAQDVTVGTFSVDPTGTVLTVPLTIDSLAATGLREFILETVSDPVAIRSESPITFDIQ
jgi:hypothetical protein